MMPFLPSNYFVLKFTQINPLFCWKGRTNSYGGQDESQQITNQVKHNKNCYTGQISLDNMTNKKTHGTFFTSLNILILHQIKMLYYTNDFQVICHNSLKKDSASPCFRSVNSYSLCFPLFSCAWVSRGCWVTSDSGSCEWWGYACTLRLVRERDHLRHQGQFFGGFGGLADGLVEEVGIAEEARAPFGRAGCEGHTLQH